MNIRDIIIVVSAMAIPVSCAHDQRDSETPEQMTPASGYLPEPVPSTTNEPAQPGSPEPMNKPPEPTPPGMDTPAPNGQLSPNPGGSPIGARTLGAEPSGGGSHAGGAPGSAGKGSGGDPGGSAGRRSLP